ncbi:MAG: SUMF1/EgtB/PvdO family nonheme iron enzyme [Anaerolineales bacterium]|nr:SUMF1/EgtB/PvdO family nonheme iron enzyme [Anaerolineales bacterium]
MKSVDQKRPLKIFLCHARSDQTRVRDLYNRLTKDGVDVWLDKVSLLPGQAWEYEIRKAVREADVVVVCLSAQFNQAGFRQKEVRLALDSAMEKPEGEIFIIPARLEECESLESLRQWHWVDLFEADGYETLMRALRARADNIGATLQLKKWLPSFTTPRKTEPRPDKAPDAVGIGGDVKESVIVSGSGNVINIGKQEAPAPKLTATQPEPKKTSPRKPNTAVIVALIGLVGTLCAALISSPVWINILFPTPMATLPRTLSDSTATSSAAEPVVTLPTEIMDTHNTIMRLVPAGEFTMGSEDGNDDEKPAHQVYLGAFYMDIYEVTNAAYKACVMASECTRPQKISSYTRSSYYGNLQYDDYPVIYVDWNQADSYCKWRGADLPTETQWEKAARGTDSRTYPWGEGIDSNRANYNSSDTMEIGSYESGKSPYGIYDMAGNVWEWTADWYGAYPGNTVSNSSYGTTYRLVRGGSWFSGDLNVRSAYRGWDTPVNFDGNIGFRCAKDATQ